MRKNLFCFIMLFSFIFPQLTFAQGNSLYYNEEYKYSIGFPQHWLIFSEEMKENLTPEERKSSPAIFIRDDGSSQMFVRHLTSENKKYGLYKELINYVQKTPIEDQNIRRKLNPISTQLGRKISNYEIDELNETVELQLVQSSKQFGEIYTTVFWKEYKDTLIELEFYHFEESEILRSEATLINDSFTITGENLSSNIEEGSIDLLNIKKIKDVSNENSFFEDLTNFIEKPYVWGSALSLLVLLVVCKLIYKFT